MIVITKPGTAPAPYLGAPIVETPVDGVWQRPSDWLPMPFIANGDQKIALLIAVYDHDSNFVAFSVDGGDYTVDWGDGTVENISAGGQAERNLQFADYDASTLASRGYRQAIVTITAQAGQTLTSASLSQQNSIAASSYFSQTLEVVAAGAGFASVSFEGAASSTALEQFTFIGECNITSTSQMFQDCYSLQSIPLLDTSAVTNMYRMFQNCLSLQSIPLLDTSLVTNMSQMFFNCRSLQSIPLLDTSSVTDMYQMFFNCRSLQLIPLLNTSLVTNMSQILSSCFSLGKGAFQGTKVDIDYSNCKLSQSAINDIFTNLATASATVNVSGNWGAATCDPTIATAKGWTVITS